jgi:hypothetical protein
MFKLKNITGSPITTLLGVLFVIVALYSVLISKTCDWGTATPIIGFGLALLHVKDPEVNAGGGAAVLLVLAMIAIGACKSHKATQAIAPIIQLVPVHDTVTTTVEAKHDTVYTPGETMTRWIPYNCDSAGRLHLLTATTAVKRQDRLRVQVAHLPDGEKELLVSANCDSLVTVNNSLKTTVKQLSEKVLLPPAPQEIVPCKEVECYPWLWFALGCVTTIGAYFGLRWAFRVQ